VDHDIARLQAASPLQDELMAARLGPEWLVSQRRQREEYAAELAEQRAAHAQQRDDSIRTQALHGALMLEIVPKDADAVLESARKLEAFLRGEPAEQRHDA
jgi:hypothetical protein